MNLNDSPSAGPLTAADLAPYRRTGAMTGVDINAVHRKARPTPTPTHCAGPCDQGRELCPCPEACERAPDELSTAAGVIVWVAGSLAAWAAVISLVQWLRA